MGKGKGGVGHQVITSIYLPHICSFENIAVSREWATKDAGGCSSRARWVRRDPLVCRGRGVVVSPVIASVPGPSLCLEVVVYLLISPLQCQSRVGGTTFPFSPGPFATQL